jgi:DNA-binding winged helix-turn-helix (wHTH) protein
VQFLFADHALDADRRELRRGAELIAIEPQVFDLLVYLLQNRDRVVSKDDLLASVWGGRIVSDSTLTSRVNAARKAVGDSQRLIRAIARKGLRFVGSVCTQANGEAPIWVGRTWQPPFRLLSARRWRRSGPITRIHGRITRWAASICSRGVSKIR